MERRKKYWFYRSSITSQLKQHQLLPTEYGKYVEEEDASVNSYHSPVLDKYTGSIQYCRKAKIFDKFAQCVSAKVDAGINFLEKTPEKLPYIYKQHSSNVPLQRERNLNTLMKETPLLNNSSQDSRRVTQSGLINGPVLKKKPRNQQREFTNMREPKRKETLHIHKSFSFKSTSKREKASKPEYKYCKWREPSQPYTKGQNFSSFFQA